MTKKLYAWRPGQYRVFQLQIPDFSWWASTLVCKYFQEIAPWVNRSSCLSFLSWLLLTHREWVLAGGRALSDGSIFFLLFRCWNCYSYTHNSLVFWSKSTVFRSAQIFMLYRWGLVYSLLLICRRFRFPEERQIPKPFASRCCPISQRKFEQK